MYLTAHPSSELVYLLTFYYIVSWVMISQLQVLCNIQMFAKAMPSLFAPHFEDFFICSSDPYQIKTLKLEILSFIATDSSISSIFREFQVWSLSHSLLSCPRHHLMPIVNRCSLFGR